MFTWGDSLIGAVKVINQYLEDGNTVYLWDGTQESENNTLVLNKKSELKFVILSKAYEIKKGEQ